jgi:hypothetical protein
MAAQKRYLIVQTGRYSPCPHVIIRPRRSKGDFIANGPQVQGVSAQVFAKAECISADALQLEIRSALH